MDSTGAYEKFANDFLRKRDQSLIGSKVVEQWVQTLPRKAEIIEIACGGGYPITKSLIDEGLKVWAIDSSITLIRKFQSRFPDVPIKCERVQDSNFFGKKFDAAIAIGIIFLLPEYEQAKVIKRISDILLPGGKVLFSAPVEAGSWKDMNTGINCISLGYKKYAELLTKSDLHIKSTFEDKGKNNYYEAERLNWRC
ncbi:MAG: class I SAM-dependent methyltransferase [Gammaproteobacteria bacterium]|nr:class I SAM-dependent methyltransferase [Gammaproteobacteria bacterium]